MNIEASHHPTVWTNILVLKKNTRSFGKLKSYQSSVLLQIHWSPMDSLRNRVSNAESLSMAWRHHVTYLRADSFIEIRILQERCTLRWWSLKVHQHFCISYIPEWRSFPLNHYLSSKPHSDFKPTRNFWRSYSWLSNDMFRWIKKSVLVLGPFGKDRKCSSMWQIHLDPQHNLFNWGSTVLEVSTLCMLRFLIQSMLLPWRHDVIMRYEGSTTKTAI